MKITVITVSFNAGRTIARTLDSVAEQRYTPIEHIVIDGASTDGTVAIIRQRGGHVSRWISEPDRGIYDAMNKGIALASGEVIGFLNADDEFTGPDVVAQIAAVFENEQFDACYADLVYVPDSDPQRVVRYFSSESFTPRRLKFGQMPAHPTFYLRRRFFQEYGVFRTDYEIAADYELVTRMFYRAGIRAQYIPGVLVRMRTGGVSTRSWKSNVILNREILRACRENQVETDLFRIYSKYAVKLLQMVRRPR